MVLELERVLKLAPTGHVEARRFRAVEQEGKGLDLAPEFDVRHQNQIHSGWKWWSCVHSG